MHRGDVSAVRLESGAENDGEKASLSTEFLADRLQRFPSHLQYLVDPYGNGC